jgi:hypothetical protein
MFKLANQVLDAYDDSDRTFLKKLASVNPKCNMISPEQRAGLRDHEFALTIITKTASKLNKFPICDKDSTWLSSQYFEKNSHKLPDEACAVAAYHLKTASLKYGLHPTPLVMALAKTAASNVYYEKEGAIKPVNVVIKPDLSKIAQVEDIGKNYTTAQYAMPSVTHVKLAAKYLEENEKKIPLELIHKYAASVQRRAHELGMSALKGTIAKYASDHYSPMVDAHIRSRASLLETQPELKAMVEKLGSAKRQFTPSEFAQMLHGFDKKAGLERYYGAHLTNPYHATFAAQPASAVLYKSASQQRSLDDSELAKLVNAKYASIKEYFGEHLASEMRRDPVTIFESLPRDAKEIIVGMADGTH